jgi:hypothetical protein
LDLGETPVVHEVAVVKEGVLEVLGLLQLILGVELVGDRGDVAALSASVLVNNATPLRKKLTLPSLASPIHWRSFSWWSWRDLLLG